MTEIMWLACHYQKIDDISLVFNFRIILARDIHLCIPYCISEMISQCEWKATAEENNEKEGLNKYHSGMTHKGKYDRSP